MAIGDSGIESVLGGRADALAMNPRAQQQTMQKGRAGCTERRSSLAIY